MKKTFTKLFSTVPLLSLLVIGQSAHAQTTVLAAANTNAPVTTVTTVADDTKKADDQKAVKKADEPAAWTPTRRLWGYAFGDLYYNQHADLTNRGPESMYNGVPANRNAFQFRRVYLGYDYDIDQRFTAEVLLASEPNANTATAAGTTIANGDNLVDGKMGFFIKNFNLRYRNIWKGTDLVIGEMSTPGFALNEGGTNGATSLAEATWGYRFIEKTITDYHKNNSYDLGVALQGTFDPSTKNFGYVFMVGNNTTATLTPAANPNAGFYKIYYADIWGKFLNKQILVDIYGDYAPNSSTATSVTGQSHNMQKIFAAYVNPKFTIGAEAYIETLKNGVTNTTTHTNENADITGLSIFVKGPIIKDKLGFFARRDGYNPDGNFKSTDTYAINTLYGAYNPNYKETFYTGGLDFTPAPKIHFSPNVWLVQYKDQHTGAARVHDDHNLVYRATFYYTFGK